MAEQVLKVGDMAPDFELLNQDGAKVRLSDYRGSKAVVLLFYPNDFSPVCTEEHCTFGPHMAKVMEGEQAEVFGVSCDSPHSHRAFKEQYSIPYDLLSDSSREMSKAYGMWAGEPYYCTRRGTVIIGKDGRIRHYEIVEATRPREAQALAEAIATAHAQREDEFGVSV